jgi:hypothetical protein
LTAQVLGPVDPEADGEGEGDADADADGDELGLCDGEALGDGEALVGEGVGEADGLPPLPAAPFSTRLSA